MTELVTRRVRAYFAPIDRATETPTIFDAAQTGHFALDAPPAPWIDLGWCSHFKRRSGDATSTIAALRTGTPAMTYAQTRTAFDATVELEFSTWGKLQLTLASGSQQMNLLATTSDAAANGSGGTAAIATPLQPGSTANTLQLGASAMAFSAGDLVAVDVDYSGQTGFVGTGVSGAYVRSAADVSSDANYIRRVSLNVARVASVADGALHLETPLPAGAPASGMRACRLAGFVDREGGTFFQEWSALFVMEGEQGDRVIYHYPRLQTIQSTAEAVEILVAPLERLRLAAAFRALPIHDVVDEEMILCFRSYLPA